MLLHLSATLRAIIFALIAYSGFSIADACAKFLLHTNPVPVVMFRCAFLAGLACFIWIVSVKGFKGLHPQKWKWHIARGLSVSTIAYLCVTAFGKIQLPDFYAISFMSPFVTALLVAVVLKEKLLPHRITAIIFGFTGVMTIILPQLSHVNSGTLYAATAVAVMALNILIIRKIGPHEFLPLYGFFPFLFITLLNAPAALSHFEWPAVSEIWIYVLYACGVFVGQILISLAFAVAPAATSISPFHYTQMLWGIALGYFVFHTTPSVPTLAGAAIIILAGLYMIFTERMHLKEVSES